MQPLEFSSVLLMRKMTNNQGASPSLRLTTRPPHHHTTTPSTVAVVDVATVAVAGAPQVPGQSSGNTSNSVQGMVLWPAPEVAPYAAWVRPTPVVQNATEQEGRADAVAQQDQAAGELTLQI